MQRILIHPVVGHADIMSIVITDYVRRLLCSCAIFFTLEKEAMERCRAWFLGNPPVVAFNAGFDVAMIEVEARWLNIPFQIGTRLSVLGCVCRG